MTRTEIQELRKLIPISEKNVLLEHSAEQARTTVKHTTDTGLGLWDEVIKLVLPFPSDDPEWTQIPDIFLELINQGNGSAKRRSHFCRIPLGQFRPDPLANGRWQLSGWQIWNLDAVSAGAHSVENLLK